MDRIYKIVFTSMFIIFVTSTSAYPGYGKVLFQKGVKAYNQGHFDTAVSFFSQVVDMESLNVAAYNNRAIAHIELKNYDLALSDFMKVQMLDSEWKDLYFNIGTVYYLKKDLLKANENYSIAIQKSPDSFSAYFNRALVRDELGQYEAALEDLRAFIKVNLDHYWALSYLADIYMKLNQLKLAKYYYCKAIESTADNEYAKNQLLNLGQLESTDQNTMGVIRFGDSNKFWANWTEIDDGLLISRVGPGPLKNAGIKPGDIICGVEGRPIDKEKGLLSIRDRIVSGDLAQATIEIRRQDETFLFRMLK